MKKRELYSVDTIRFVQCFMDSILKFIPETYYIDEVFSQEELNEWAEENGYVKESE